MTQVTLSIPIRAPSHNNQFQPTDHPGESTDMQSISYTIEKNPPVSCFHSHNNAHLPAAILFMELGHIAPNSR